MYISVNQSPSKQIAMPIYIQIMFVESIFVIKLHVYTSDLAHALHICENQFRLYLK